MTSDPRPPDRQHLTRWDTEPALLGTSPQVASELATDSRGSGAVVATIARAVRPRRRPRSSSRRAGHELGRAWSRRATPPRAPRSAARGRSRRRSASTPRPRADVPAVAARLVPVGSWTSRTRPSVTVEVRDARHRATSRMRTYSGALWRRPAAAGPRPSSGSASSGGRPVRDGRRRQVDVERRAARAPARPRGRSRPALEPYLAVGEGALTSHP